MEADRPTSSTPVTAAVLNYNGRELLEALMPTLAAQTCPLRVLVVDNGSTDDSVAYLRAHWPQTTLVALSQNLGVSAGLNRCLHEARGDHVLLLNNDVELDSRCAERLLAALERAGDGPPRVGAVAAQVRFHHAPERVNSAGIEVDRLGVASERLAGRPISAAEKPTAVFGASACCALYRAEMLAEVGGIDDGYIAYLEDVDLAWRAQAAGWHASYEPGAIAYHRASYTTGAGSRRKYWLVGRSRVRLLARNATTGQLLRAAPAIFLYDLAYVLYVAICDRTLAPLHGRLAGLREWRALRRARRDSLKPVRLAPARRGWLGALRQQRAYRQLSDPRN